MERRKFLKKATITGGALFASGFIPVAAQSLSQIPNNPLYRGESDSNQLTDELIKGISDLHIHAFPDSSARSINELDFSRQAYKAGYKSVMFKSNDFSCHDRAYIIRKELPDFECFGSLCMNSVHGDKVNVVAAKKAVATEGNYCRCIWMPTLDAVYPLSLSKRKEKGIPVLNDSGSVLPEVIQVMEICAEADIIFATGHSSPKENIILAKKAKEVGVKKFVVTHANSRIWKMDHDQIKECIDYGAFIEYCCLPLLWGGDSTMRNYERMSIAEFTAFIQIAPERSFISSDLGQKDMPNPMDGMRNCLSRLLKAGVTQLQIDWMVRTNPAKLMGLG